jgi:hypothetical protein
MQPNLTKHAAYRVVCLSVCLSVCLFESKQTVGPILNKLCKGHVQPVFFFSEIHQAFLKSANILATFSS